MVALMHRDPGVEGRHCLNIAKDNDSIGKYNGDISEDSDEGGEEQSPCSLPMPRGCVECVVCRTQIVLPLAESQCGFEVKAGWQQYTEN